MTARRFSYVKLHEDFPEHPKNAGLSDAAFRLKVTAICYAHRLSTDGFVPEAVALRIARRSVVRELVDGGSLAEAPGGFLIHDYPEWNDTKAEIASRADSKRMAGAMGAATRWDGRDHGTTHVRGVNATATALDAVGSKPKPPDKVYTPPFLAFWVEYPRHVGKRDAFKAFCKALERADWLVIVEAAKAFRHDPNRTEEFTPHPQTWLNRDGWEDDPQPARGNGRVDPADAWLAAKEAGRG